LDVLVKKETEWVANCIRQLKEETHKLRCEIQKLKSDQEEISNAIERHLRFH